MDESLKTFVEQDEEVTSPSYYSLCKSKVNPVQSTSTMKQKITSEKKNKRVSKKDLSLKSKGKQIISDKPEKSTRSKRKRTGIHDLYDSIEEKFSVMERAGRLLGDLATELPGFAKCMLPSNVVYSFWLILPRSFCNLYLPKHDATIILVDERGMEYNTNFLKDRHGLSAGWRGFSITHRLLKGDIVFFHLVEPCKLKVHIVRVYGLDAIDAALSLMSMDARNVKRIESGKAKEDKTVCKAKKGKRTRRRPKKYLEAPAPEICPPQVDLQEERDTKVREELESTLVQYENCSDGFSEILEGPEDVKHLHSSEPSCCGDPCYDDHLQKGISCLSTARRYYSSSALAI